VIFFFPLSSNRYCSWSTVAFSLHLSCCRLFFCPRGWKNSPARQLLRGDVIPTPGPRSVLIAMSSFEPFSRTVIGLDLPKQLNLLHTGENLALSRLSMLWLLRLRSHQQLLMKRDCVLHCPKNQVTPRSLLLKSAAGFLCFQPSAQLTHPGETSA